MNHCGVYFGEVAVEVVESVACVTAGEIIGKVCSQHSFRRSSQAVSDHISTINVYSTPAASVAYCMRGTLARSCILQCPGPQRLCSCDTGLFFLYDSLLVCDAVSASLSPAAQQGHGDVNRLAGVRHDAAQAIGPGTEIITNLCLRRTWASA